jgi:four helix bundle protein
LKFEDLEVWKRAVRLSVDVYKHLCNLKDFGFKDQVTRSSLSIPSNIAEGFERSSHKECVVFLSYAKGSCGELRTQIYIGMEIGYIDRDTGEKWIRETEEISLMIGGLMRTRRNFAK